MVILGSPHFSVAEFRQLAPLVAGRRAHPRVKFLITSGRLMKELAEEAGVLAPIVEFGAQITLDTCILASPMLPTEIETLMTNSAKYAYYAPSLLNTRASRSAASPTACAPRSRAASYATSRYGRPRDCGPPDRRRRG